VRTIFEQAGRGHYGLTELCEIAERIGLRSRRGRKLSRSSLAYMLRNPFYAGSFWYKGTLHTEKVEHEALVSKALFERVQDVLDGNGFVKKERFTYLFSHTMDCQECGSVITGQVQKGHRYYHCSRWNVRRFGQTCDHRKYHREEQLTNMVANYLKSLVLPTDIVELVLDALREYEEENERQAPEQAKALERNLKRAQEMRKNLIQLKISPSNSDGSMITDDEFRTQKSELNDEIMQIEGNIMRLAHRDRSWLKQCREFFDFAESLAESFRKGTPDEKRELLKNIGKVHLNQEKLDVELAAPYSYLVQLRDALTRIGTSPEPPKTPSACGKTGISRSECPTWWAVLEEIRTFFRSCPGWLRIG